MKKERRYVGMEIIKTEEDYCGNLSALMDVYHKSLSSLVGTNNQILSDSEIKFLFGNIQSIMQVNQSFLEDLKKIDPNDPLAKFGSVFEKTSAFFKMYTVYIKNKGEADPFFNKLQTNSTFTRWEAQLKLNNPVLKQRSLADFLIMPVQRV